MEDTGEIDLSLSILRFFFSFSFAVEEPDSDSDNQSDTESKFATLNVAFTPITRSTRSVSVTNLQLNSQSITGDQI